MEERGDEGIFLSRRHRKTATEEEEIPQFPQSRQVKERFDFSSTLMRNLFIELSREFSRKYKLVDAFPSELRTLHVLVSIPFSSARGGRDFLSGPQEEKERKKMEKRGKEVIKGKRRTKGFSKKRRGASRLRKKRRRKKSKFRISVLCTEIKIK